MAANRKYMARDAVYFLPDLPHLSHYSVPHRTRPPNSPFCVLFFNYYKNQLWFPYNPDQTCRKGGNVLERFYTFTSCVCIGGIFLFVLEENKSTVLFNLSSMDIFVIPENLIISHYEVTDFKFLYLWSCI